MTPSIPSPSNGDAPDAAPDARPVVSVVIVSFQTRELTLRCLRELFLDLRDFAPDEADVWVVDNASNDGSADAIAREFPSVHLVAQGENLGFGRANNVAFERAQGEFFFLLNSDAFVHRGALRELVNYLRAHPGVGVVGPKLQNADGTLQASCWKFPSPQRAWIEALGVARAFSSHPTLGDYYRWAHDDERRVDFLIGAALLVRRKVWEEVGGFDREFFLYAEETDWLKRIWNAGHAVVFWPRALVTHLGGASGASNAPRTSTLFWQGQERYILKHFGARGWRAFRGALLVSAIARLTAFVVLAHAPKHRKSARERLRFFGWQIKRLLSTRAPARASAPAKPDG